jgi:hypothetical protein
MVTLRPRASKIAAKEAEAMPLPSEETTPPVTNMKRVMKNPKSLRLSGRSRQKKPSKVLKPAGNKQALADSKGVRKSCNKTGE